MAPHSRESQDAPRARWRRAASDCSFERTADPRILARCASRPGTTSIATRSSPSSAPEEWAACGRTLRAHLIAGDTSLERRLTWLLEIARALAAAHKRGIVHRDIKPENVMVRDDGVVKVLDFGIAGRTAIPVDPKGATLVEAPHGTVGAGDTNVGGTPRYMAPEQVRGERLDGRADQFAWGVLAYEALTGAVPWDASLGAVQLVSQILSRDPELPSTRRAEIGSDVDAIVMRALKKGRDDRFARMDDVVAALEALDASHPAANEASRGALAPGGRPRWRAVAGVVALVACAVLLVGAWRAERGTRTRPTPRPLWPRSRRAGWNRRCRVVTPRGEMRSGGRTSSRDGAPKRSHTSGARRRRAARWSIHSP